MDMTLIVGPNVVVEWLVFLLRIWEVPGLNLGPETSYSDRGLVCVFSVPPGEYWNSSLELYNDRFLPIFFPAHPSLSPYHSRLYSLSY
jgi:hypothetical protein